MANFDMKGITGVIPAMVTCFDEKENLDERRMRETVRFLLSQKIGGLYLTGSTGETFLMTPEERRRSVEIVTEEVGGRVPIIVHVGDIGTKKSIEHAVHAHKMGADAVSSVPPFYWKFNDNDIFGYYKDITESTPLPMIVYNIPLAGLVGFDMIKRLGGIDGVAGVKYTAATHFEILRIKEALGNDFSVYSGSDEMAVSGLTFRADGLIGSFYNVIPDLFIAINDSFEKGDLATAVKKQQLANKIIFTALDYDMVAVIKRMMSWMGVDAGYSRKPFTNYFGAEEAAIKDVFRRLRDTDDFKGIAFMDAL